MADGLGVGVVVGGQHGAEFCWNGDKFFLK